MGYVLAYGNCINCGTLFSFNPAKVPSIRVDGVREPVCRTCIEQANEVRRAAGITELTILPDAYEPCEENEL
mgnify:CR=1 FL=1